MSGYLLDTHAFLWWVSIKNALPHETRTIIIKPDSEIFVSFVTGWEIAIKVSVGKLNDPGTIQSLVKRAGFDSLSIDFDHVEIYKALPLHHRDPFDRMLIAQALAENLTLISNETIFDAYGVKRLWD